MDVRQALDDMCIDEKYAAEIGLRLFKVGMPWPLEAEAVRHFAEGLEEILVVEEKRQIIEYQLKEMLYNWREDVRPRVVGKYDETGEWPLPEHRWLLPPTAELTPAIVARAIAARIGRFHQSARISDYIAFLDAKAQALAKPKVTLMRTPWFCPGCPHNQSTKVPEGSCALGGVGCHLMAVMMGRNTLTISHMGGEGAAWLGVSGHSGTQHVFANMGDGTYFHSGLLAIRAAVAAKVNITYKLLFNDAVAMTGGQPVDGTLTVPQLTRQLAAEDVARIIVMSDEPEKYRGVADFAPGVEIRHRERLDETQRELRETPGVTALIYDQTCAAEKRRRASAAASATPRVRIFINEAVCEGCGDCAAKSNCLAVVPVETEFGRKRAIDQFACNKDFLLPRRLLPEHGHRAWRQRTARPGHGRRRAGFADLPEPRRAGGLADPYGILIAGVGGTGVVTIGALLGMAAHLEGKGVTVLDMTGLAQKGGAVMSHVRLADRQEQLHSARIATGEARLLLGCDIVVAVSDDACPRPPPAIPTPSSTPGAASPANSCAIRTANSPPAPWKASVIDTVGREPTTVHRRHAPGHAPDGPQHRHQHLHARLRLPARPDAAFAGGHPARHRTQRRRRRGQPARLPLGPPRRPRSRRHRCAGRRRRGQPKATPSQPRRIIAHRRRTWSPIRTKPTRSATCPGAARARRRTQAWRRWRGVDRQPSRAITTSCSPTRTNSRSRACSPSPLRQGAGGQLRGRLPAQLPHHPALVARRHTRRRTEEDPLRPLAAAGDEADGPLQVPARHRPQPLRPHPGTHPGTRPDRRLRIHPGHILDQLAATNLPPPSRWRAAGVIRGYGPVKERSVIAAKAKQAELMANYKEFALERRQAA
jgi:hypothetical protein